MYLFDTSPFSKNIVKFHSLDEWVYLFFIFFYDNACIMSAKTKCI